MRDYSQWGEQPIILKFFEGHPPGRLLDVGAWDGVTGSNTRALLELGWRGVLIEPNPVGFAELLENRNGLDIEYVHAALMPEPAMPKFYDTVPRSDGERHQAGQCSTAFQGHKVQFMVERVYHSGYCTVADLLKNFGNRHDFVSIDIEGMDLAVLRTMGPLLYHTKLLCVEDTIPNTPDWDPEHYARLREAAAAHGFTREVGRTSYPHPNGPDGRMPANTLLARP